MYKFLLKPILFLFPPEFIHGLVSSFLTVSCKIPGLRQLIRTSYIFSDKRLTRKLFGITFKNPVGLAAGFDKNAKLVDGMECLGFGFVEIGTVTPKAQPGNEKPRMFRLATDEGLINRMGFNNDGAEVIAGRLKRNNNKVIIGGNIGKNKVTPNQEAIKDYETCFQKLFDHVDYFVVNVSSPNTPGLRELQDKEPLKRILSQLQELNNRKPERKPILLKIAPDLSNEQLDDIIEIINETALDGVVATNTTINRSNLQSPQKQVKAYGAGGLSGKPLTERSTEVIRYLADKSEKSFTIIGVGGIHSPDDAIAKLKAGADLVQIYTGLIYEGPSLVKRINKRILSVY